MATVTHRVTTPDTGNTPNTSGTFTPTAGDLLVVFVTKESSVSMVSADLTSSISGFTFTLVRTQTFRSGVDTFGVFVSNRRVSDTSSQTVTIATGSDSGGGSIISVYSVSGMTRNGSAAVLKQGGQSNQAAGAPAPSVALGGAVLTGNPVIAAVANATNPATMTPPSSPFAESQDVGYAVGAVTGLETAFANSGFTGSTVTWGGNSASIWASLAIELDTSPYKLTPAEETDSGVAPTFPTRKTLTPAVETDSGVTLGTNTYARRFDGINDDLRCSIGACSLTGAYTIAAVIRRNALGEADAYISNHTSGGSGAITLGTDANNHLSIAPGTNTSTFTVPAQKWVIVVVNKAAGTVVPRFHLWDGTWTHENAPGNMPDSQDQTGGTIRFGEMLGFAFYSMDIAQAGEWNVSLTDVQIEELSGRSLDAWLQNSGAAPVGLWPFAQPFTSVPVPDVTGHGADQSARTETTVINDGPANWDSSRRYSLTPATETDQARPRHYRNDSAMVRAIRADSPSIYWRLEGSGEWPDEDHPTGQVYAPDASGNERWSRVYMEGGTPWEMGQESLLLGDPNPSALGPPDIGVIAPYNSYDEAVAGGNKWSPWDSVKPGTWEFVIQRVGGTKPSGNHDRDTIAAVYNESVGVPVTIYMPWGETDPIDNVSFWVRTTTVTWEDVGIGVGEPHHVILRWNPTSSTVGELPADTAELFVDGESRGQLTQDADPGFSTPPDFSYSVTWGTNTMNGKGPHSYLDELAFYESVLTEARISRHAQIARGIFLEPATETDAAQVLDVELQGDATPVNAAPLNLVWDLRTAVDGSVLDLKWDTATTVDGGVLDLLWDTRSQVDAVARILKWDLRSTVDAAARTFVWDTLAEVNSPILDLEWDIKSEVNGSVLDLIWDMRTAVNGGVLDFIWDLASEDLVLFVQGDDGQSGASSTTLQCSLAATPTAGNLLVFCMAGDKNTGALTLSGFTEFCSLQQASASLYIWWKVSNGTEQTINPSWANTSAAGNTAWYAEYKNDGVEGSNWQVLAGQTHISDDSTVTSWSTGTTGTPSKKGIAIAAEAIDSSGSVT